MKALNTPFPKEKFIIYDSSNGGYVSKVGSRHIFFKREQTDAKIFDFREEAEAIAKQINGEIKQAS